MAGGDDISFALSAEQELLVAEVRRFAEERIRPGVAERDKSHEFPAEILKEMGQLGLLGMLVPEAYGGAGSDVLSYVLAIDPASAAFTGQQNCRSQSAEFTTQIPRGTPTLRTVIMVMNGSPEFTHSREPMPSEPLCWTNWPMTCRSHPTTHWHCS